MAMISDFQLGLDVQVTGLDKTILEMQQLLPEVRAALEQTIGKDADTMRDRARELASGDVLQSRSGKYVESIKSEVHSTENGVFGFVSSDDPRVDLFEYGGTTPARDILPNVAQALRFAGGMMGRLSLGTVGMIFAAIVHRPIVTYRPRPVIHAAFDEMEIAVEHDIESASHQVIIDHHFG